MACSDNVVRAGLTPKYQDVDTLVEMLDYSMGPPENRKFEGFKMDEYTILYNPPVLDFAVDMIEVSFYKVKASINYRNEYEILCKCILLHSNPKYFSN